MKRQSKLAFALLVPATLLFAADFWKVKPPSDWTDKEAARMLAQSPWAKEAAMQFNGSRGAEPATSGGGRGGGRGGGMSRGAGMADASGDMGGGDGMGGPGMGGGEGGAGGGMQMPKVLVRWESAKPVQEAMTKAEIKHPLQKQFAEFYVVSVVGYPMMGGRRPGGGQAAGPGQEGGRPQPDMAGMKQRLLTSTTLRRKGQDPIAPTDAAIARGSSATTIFFLFPRSAGIQETDKEVVFQTQAGPMEIQAKFALKDMAVAGKLEM